MLGGLSRFFRSSAPPWVLLSIALVALGSVAFFVAREEARLARLLELAVTNQTESEWLGEDPASPPPGSIVPAAVCNDFRDSKIEQYLVDLDEEAEWLAGESRRLVGTGSRPGRLAMVNLRYVFDLLFTLSLVLPVAAFLSGGSLVLAILQEQVAQRAGSRFQNCTQWLTRLTDSVPYILWCFPALLIAGRFKERFSTEGFSRYWLYLALVFLGFVSFLISFFVRQYGEEIRDARSRLLALRLDKSSEPQVFRRFFRLQLARTTFLPQVLFGGVFILLFDYSFYGVLKYHEIDQSGRPKPVFARANEYRERTIGYLQDHQRTGAPVDFRGELKALLRREGLPGDLRRVAAELWEKPYLSLDVARRNTLRSLAASEAEMSRPSAGQMLLCLPHFEQRYVFFDGIKNFYMRLNWCLTFLLFMSAFTLFASRELTDEA